VKGLIPEDLRQAALRELDKCNKCGFCLTNCPTYLVTGVEWEVARGRLALVRAALEGELDPAELPASTWSCILCRNCRPHCPPGVEMDRVVVAIRAGLSRHLRVSPLRRMIMRGLLPRRGRLAAAATLGDWGQTMGLDRLAALWPDRRMRTAQAYAPRMRSPAALRRRWQAEGLYGSGGDGGGARVGVFLGCATELGMGPTVLALGRILRRLGIGAEVIPAACCGLPAYSWGDPEGARLAGRAMLAAAGLGNGDRPKYEALISPCASCASFLSEYGRLFAGQPEAAAAAALAGSIVPATVYLARAGLPELLRQQGVNAVGPHTFHDPCHLAHYLNGRAEVRDVLTALPGNGYREMTGADSCCGAGGSYVMTHPEHSDAVLRRKLDSVEQTGAKLLTSACPGCILQLRRGLRERGSDIRVAHLLEAAWEALDEGRQAGFVQRGAR